jgi:hypothetical protein
MLLLLLWYFVGNELSQLKKLVFNVLLLLSLKGLKQNFPLIFLSTAGRLDVLYFVN